MPTKIKPETRVTLNAYRIISDAVERGVSWGYTRAYKYTDKPDKDLMTGQMYTSIMSELCEVLDFGDIE